MSKFTLDIEKFIQKAKKNPETVMRQVSIKLFSAIVLASPVDTGRFRMNWQAGNSRPATGTVAGVDKSGSKAIKDTTSFILGSSSWSEFTLANNLPYAAKLEFGGYPGDGPKTVGGYSTQAPQGTVRVNVSRFQRLIDAEAAKVR